MNNILSALGVLLVLVYTSSCSNQIKTYQIKDQLSFDCPVKIDTAPELFTILKSINKNIIYFGVINNNDNRYMLSVAKYTADEPITIDTAFFDFTANEVPDNKMGEFQILGAGKYVKENYTYFRKISCTNGTILNVMFYLMKENKSNYLFEFKMTGSIDQKEYIIDVLEKTVSSVEFE
ncbi:MAG: hypothetical protein ACK44N_01265 [Bacteroidota bacterium]|jgi:hypothetical protein